MNLKPTSRANMKPTSPANMARPGRPLWTRARCAPPTPLATGPRAATASVAVSGAFSVLGEPPPPTHTHKISRSVRAERFRRTGGPGEIRRAPPVFAAPSSQHPRRAWAL